MTATTQTVTVTIPTADASPNKMAKNGWKCWAKALSGVNTPANTDYDYHGEFLPLGTAELEVGTVLLHVDDSSNSGVGVVMVNLAGKGFIYWMNTASDRWAAFLAGEARRLLAMSAAERVAEVAAAILAEPAEMRARRRAKPLSESDRAFYTALTGASPAADPRAEALAEIRRLMTEHGITAADLS